jgi:hypothetical protein
MMHLRYPRMGGMFYADIVEPKVAAFLPRISPICPCDWEWPRIREIACTQWREKTRHLLYVLPL